MKKFLLITIILIFLIFVSFNISNWIVYQKYNKATALNYELEQIMDSVRHNETLYNQLASINEDVKFINSFCFEG